MGPLTQRELVRCLRSFGWEGPYGGGSHQYLRKAERRLTIPNPHGAALSVALIRRIIQQAAISPEEWDSVQR
jgi:predicted RNA binding protein YcfA (HicA-like mRNA interferase family)